MTTEKQVVQHYRMYGGGILCNVPFTRTNSTGIYECVTCKRCLKIIKSMGWNVKPSQDNGK